MDLSTRKRKPRLRLTNSNSGQNQNVQANKNGDNNNIKRNGNGNDNKNENNSNKPFYQNCKRRHDGECMRNSNKCFLCGEAGHLKRDYPKNKDKKSLAPSKLNAVNLEDVTRNNLVKGMITIYDTPSSLLFNLGCTLSYMQYRLIRELGLKPIILDPPLNVSTLSDNQILVNKQVQNKSVV